MSALQQVLLSYGGSSGPPPLGYPNILSITGTSFGTAATAHACNMPATTAVGDLLLLKITWPGAVSPTTPTGWTLLLLAGSSVQRSIWYYRVADGTEGGTTVNVVSASAVRAAAGCYRIEAGTWALGSPLAIAQANGSTANPDPPAVTPWWGTEKTLWIADMTETDQVTISGYPLADNQTSIVSNPGSPGAGQAQIGLCTSDQEVSSLNPSTFTTASTSWFTSTLAVRPYSGLTERTGGTWSQSTVYSGIAATDGNMRDDNNNVGNQTGGATNNGASEWIKVDLGSALAVQEVIIGGGDISGWGPVAVYANGAVIQSSPDNSAWTTQATVASVGDTVPRDRGFKFSPVTARYWRIQRSGYLATCTFRLFG